MAVLERDGVRIHYDVAGHGPAVLVTHGFTASSHMFAGTADALASDHTVIRWDIRGHAGSDAGDDPSMYTTAASVADMDALLDAVGAERAVLAGHSLGGYLTLEYYLAHRERVRALVLIGTGPGYRKDDARAGWNRMAAKMADNFEAKGLAALGRSAEVKASVHRDARGLVLAARGILTQYDGHVMDALPTIDVPTLVIVGERDEMFLGSAAYFGQKVPGCEVEIISDAGHAPNLDQPELFHAHLQAFLARIEQEDHR